MSERILIVEDEANINRLLAAALQTAGYATAAAKNGREAMAILTADCIDAVILDLGLPDLDGQTIISSVRKWSEVPILVLSARTHERDKVLALDNGADDYLVKPFAMGELLARIRTVLRHSVRQKAAASGITSFQTGDFRIDFDKRRVFLSGADVRLTQTEYRILELLTQNAGRVLTYDYIGKRIWGPAAPFDRQILRVNMANIRRKIEPNPAMPRYLLTDIGVGYRFSEE